MKTINISPAVALKEARSEIDFLRNRNLILAQAVQDLQDRLVVKAPAEPAPPVDTDDENHD